MQAVVLLDPRFGALLLGLRSHHGLEILRRHRGNG
jgi:hypothetical protein